MGGLERIETERLVLRRPVAADASAVFARYSSDPEVTRFMSWPRHRSIEDCSMFLQFSDTQWERGVGPYLIEARDGGRLLGGTGLGFETPQRAATGYVLARDAWGQGYATEALRAVVDVAARAGVRRLYALTHTEHSASWHVLEKCAFVREGILRSHTEFPNLSPGELSDVLSYARVLKS